MVGPKQIDLGLNLMLNMPVMCVSVYVSNFIGL